MTKVIIYPSGLRALMSSPGVTAEIARRGQAVAATARSTAPVGGPRDGHIRDSIEVVPDVINRRARIRVVANARYATVLAKRNDFLLAALGAGR